MFAAFLFSTAAFDYEFNEAELLALKYFFLTFSSKQCKCVQFLLRPQQIVNLMEAVPSVLHLLYLCVKQLQII